MIRVQREDFTLQAEYEALQREGQAGAIVTFSGLVRDFTRQDGQPFLLQHYPGMTEKVLTAITRKATETWPLQAVRVIHRVGELQPGDQIVFVGVSSAHRRDAFEACHYIIDMLKTQAPFWKKEGDTWVEAKDTDARAAQRWLLPED